jgi:hypothetical protein
MAGAITVALLGGQARRWASSSQCGDGHRRLHLAASQKAVLRKHACSKAAGVQRAPGAVTFKTVTAVLCKAQLLVPGRHVGPHTLNVRLTSSVLEACVKVRASCRHTSGTSLEPAFVIQTQVVQFALLQLAVTLEVLPGIANLVLNILSAWCTARDVTNTSTRCHSATPYHRVALLYRT